MFCVIFALWISKAIFTISESGEDVLPRTLENNNLAHGEAHHHDNGTEETTDDHNDADSDLDHDEIHGDEHDEDEHDHDDSEYDEIHDDVHDEDEHDHKDSEHDVHDHEKIYYRRGNAYVLNGVVLVLAGFATFALGIWHYDQIDFAKWKINEALFNFSDSKTEYEVFVHTGNLLKAGHRGKVFFSIHGTEGATPYRILNVLKREVFQQGNVDGFYINFMEHIGEPRYVQLMLRPSLEDRAPLWYLERIVVVDIHKRRWYNFELDCWISAFMNQGVATIHEMHPENVPQHYGWKKLLWQNCVYQLRCSHLLISLFSRNPRTNFWRNQRLACCLAATQWTLLGCAISMHSFTSPPHDPLSRNTILIGVVVSVIVTCIVEVHTIFFQKAQVDKEIQKSHYMIFKPFVPRKPGFSLPHWSIYVGFTLVFMITLVATSFCTKCAYEWNNRTGHTFLTAVTIALVYDYGCLQFIKTAYCFISDTVWHKKAATFDPYIYRYGTYTEED